MAAYYVEAILSNQPQGPFRVGGYCSGGLIALEIAQQLKRSGKDVELLALMGTQIISGLVALNQAQWDTEVLAIMSFGGELKMVVSPDKLQQLDSNMRMDHVWEEFCSQSPDDAAQLGQSTFRRLYTVYLANIVACINYVPQPYEGRLVLFEFMERPENFNLHSAWEELCHRPLERHGIPGNHITFMRQPNVKVLAQKLNSCLNR
jgi:thioesterase domain-containing protein